MEPKTQEADWESCRLTIPANFHVNSNKVLLLFKKKKMYQLNSFGKISTMIELRRSGESIMSREEALNIKGDLYVLSHSVMSDSVRPHGQ